MKAKTNEELIQQYLNRYRNSKASMNMRRSCLNYFFGANHFNFKDHIFKIRRGDVMDYRDYLKNYINVEIETRRNKWAVFTSFLNYLMDYYEEFSIRIPSINVENWTPKKYTGKVNKRERFTSKEKIEQVMAYFKARNFKHYLIFRIIALGLRKGTAINLKWYEVDLKRRLIHPHEDKKRDWIFYFDEELAKYLEIYLKERKKMDTNLDYLFLTNYRGYHKYSAKVFNNVLKNACEQLGFENYITCQTFRATINNLREKMGCQTKDLKRLLGHKITDVTIKNYTEYDYEDHKKLSERWNPYKFINL